MIEVIAFHEAGHCTLALLYGAGVERVTIQHQAGASGRCYYGGGEVSLEQWAAVFLAGQLAEEKRFGRMNGSMGRRALDDAQITAMTRGKLYASNHREFHQAARQRAVEDLDTNWDIVQGIAGALLQHGALSGSQLDQMFPRTARLA